MNEEKILARLDSIDEKVTSTKKGVERLEEVVFFGSDGGEAVVVRLKTIETKLGTIEKNGKKKSIAPPSSTGGAKIQLALIALVVTIVTAVSAFAMKAIE